MTREILHADIVLARELLDAGCEPSGIVTRLSLRGVEPDQAVWLTQRLRTGESISLPVADAASKARRHRSGYRRSHSHHRHQKQKHRWMKPATALPIFSAHHPGRRHRLRWYVSRAFVGGLVFLGVACLCFVLYEAFKRLPRPTNEDPVLRARALVGARAPYLFRLDSLKSRQMEQDWVDRYRGGL